MSAYYIGGGTKDVWDILVPMEEETITLLEQVRYDKLFVVPAADA